jgi:hypothetical protein
MPWLDMPVSPAHPLFTAGTRTILPNRPHQTATLVVAPPLVQRILLLIPSEFAAVAPVVARTLKPTQFHDLVSHLPEYSIRSETGCAPFDCVSEALQRSLFSLKS